MKASTAISSVPTKSNAAVPARTGSSSSTDETFRLDGPSRAVDGRIQAWRNDLADISLAGQVFAPHYARPLIRACGSLPTPVWPGPTTEGDPVSELLPGEEFAVLEYAGGRAWGFCRGDHVVGYVEAIELAEPMAATHIVVEKCAPVTPDDNIASPVIAHLFMGSRLHGIESGACLTTEYGCVSLAHLRRIEEPEEDPVAVAERLLGAPWRTGGRTANGIDSTGLIQLAFSLCGVAAPRLPDQFRNLGAALTEEAAARRGDLVLFEAGAGLMIDDLLMIHASRAAGKVCVEPAAIHETERRRLPI